jgi:hypothetical protein
MTTHGKTDATLWSEIVQHFGGMSPDVLYDHCTRYGPPRGITVTEQWLWDKLIRHWKGLTMARKKAEPSASSQHNAAQTFRGFVTIELTDKQFTEFDGIYPHEFPTTEDFDRVLAQCKLTVTPREGTFNACLFPQEGLNAGYALSAFADTAWEAVALCMFKYRLTWKGDWSQIAKKPGKRRG